MIPRLLHHISRLDRWPGGNDDRNDDAHYDTTADIEERTVPVGADLANTVSSRVDELESFRADENHRVSMDPSVMHAPVLDIDFPVFVIPSSTAGHFHLYIEKPIPWDDYRDLLEVLGRCGIIEPGYARASMERGASFVRTPTSIKPTAPADEIPAAADAGKEPF